MRAILYVFLVIPFLSFSQNNNQDVLAIQGDFSVSPTMSLSWTLGESFVETVNLRDRIYTQGFQQPILKVQKIPNDQFSSFDALIFPNPSNGILNISVENTNEYFKLEILDVTGRSLHISDRNNGTIELDLSNYGSGIYFIRMSNIEKARHSLYKIVKL